jgi:hypothetical protein
MKAKTFFTPTSESFGSMQQAVGYSLLGMSGFRVMQNDQLYFYESYQYRFPKSKRKRIRKKWSKNKAYFKSRKVWYCLLVGDDKLYCPKWILERIENGSADDCKVFSIPSPELFSYQPPEFKYTPVDNGFKMSVNLEYYQVVQKPSAFVISNVTT